MVGFILSFILGLNVVGAAETKFFDPREVLAYPVKVQVVKLLEGRMRAPKELGLARSLEAVAGEVALSDLKALKFDEVDWALSRLQAARGLAKSTELSAGVDRVLEALEKRAQELQRSGLLALLYAKNFRLSPQSESLALKLLAVIPPPVTDDDAQVNESFAQALLLTKILGEPRLHPELQKSAFAGAFEFLRKHPRFGGVDPESVAARVEQSGEDRVEGMISALAQVVSQHPLARAEDVKKVGALLLERRHFGPFRSWAAGAGAAFASGVQKQAEAAALERGLSARWQYCERLSKGDEESRKIYEALLGEVEFLSALKAQGEGVDGLKKFLGAVVPPHSDFDLDLRIFNLAVPLEGHGDPRFLIHFVRGSGRADLGYLENALAIVDGTQIYELADAFWKVPEIRAGRSAGWVRLAEKFEPSSLAVLAPEIHQLSQHFLRDTTLSMEDVARARRLWEGVRNYLQSMGTSEKIFSEKLSSAELLQKLDEPGFQVREGATLWARRRMLENPLWGAELLNKADQDRPEQWARVQAISRLGENSPARLCAALKP